MTGKENLTLSELVIDILKEMGHQYDSYGSTKTDYPHGEDTLRFSVTTSNYSGIHYLVKVDKTANTARFDPGLLPGFNFYDPNSIVLFKAAAMQMPLIVSIREIADKLINATDW